MKILDSNIWISYIIKDDINHKKANEIFDNLENEVIYISEYIIIEITTILLQKWWKDITNLFIKMYKNNTNIKIIYVSQILFNNFLNFFVKNNYNKLSFIDQSLLYLSKEFEIITFDKNLIKEIEINKK